MATSDIFLKIDGIDGESADSKHKDEIDILSWSLGASNAGSMAHGGGGGVGRVSFQDLHFTKKYDRASPNISKNCISGKHFKDATISMSIAGGSQEDFLVIKLKEVYITSHQVTAGAGGEVTDSVSMAYADIEYAYKPQKPDGSLGGEVKFGVDQRTTTVR